MYSNVVYRAFPTVGIAFILFNNEGNKMIQSHPNQMELVLPQNDYAYSKISSSAMLVDMSLSVWTARKLDKKVSAEVDQAKSTRARAGNYHKNLLAGSSKLEEIGKIASTVRNWNYMVTTPWSDAGTRLLPATLFMDYKARLAMYEQHFTNAVDSFLKEYDNLVTGAAFQLGDLFDRSEYPEADKVRNKFGFYYTFSPVPSSGDFRVDIGEAGMAELREQYEGAFKSRMESSTKDIWSRVYTTLSHLSDRLDFTDENKKRVYDSLLDNANELCGLLKHLNITNDPELEKARVQLNKVLSGVTTEGIKEDWSIRQDTKKAVDEMLSKFDF